MSALTPNPDFAEITRLIDSARQRAYQAVNTTLIELYWQVGAYLSGKIAAAEWGEGVVEQLAQHIASTQVVNQLAVAVHAVPGVAIAPEAKTPRAGVVALDRRDLGIGGQEIDGSSGHGGTSRYRCGGIGPQR